MDDELLALLADIRTATKQAQNKAHPFETVGYSLLEAIDSMRDNPAGLVAIYERTAEPPFDLDQPFLWHLTVLVRDEEIAYGELFRRLKALHEEQLMGDASA